MEAKNKVKIKIKNQLSLKTRLIYTLGVGGLIVAIAIIFGMLFNVGINLESNAANKKVIKHIASTSAGEWNDYNIWNTNSSNLSPEGDMEIEIKHSINSSSGLSLSGVMIISRPGRLVIDEIIVENGGELSIEGELYVNKLIFKKGSIVNLSKDAMIVVNEDFTNEKKSNNIYIDGNLYVFGNYFNEADAEVYGEGRITVNGNFKGEGLEHKISPLVDVAGEIEQTDKDPVNLIYFQANSEGSSTILKWTTEFESNVNFFTVERSTNGVDFEEIGQIFGAGFSSNPTNYTFEDIKSPTDKLVFYRLQYSSFDGIFKQLNMIVAEELHRIVQE